MRTNLKQVLTLTLFFCFFSGLMAQNAFWKKVTKKDIRGKEKVQRNSSPKQFQLYHLNLQAFQQKLKDAPLRSQVDGPSSFILHFPTPSGKMVAYRVTASPILPENLAEKYPSIKTYSAVGIDDPTATMRFSITSFGLHTMTLSGKTGETMIDPYTEDHLYYMVYNTKTLSGGHYPFRCLLDADDFQLPKKALDNQETLSINTDDSTLRTYRLALSCTADYGNVFANTPGEEKEDIMAEMTIAINRVNEVYEREIAITLQFVDNEDDLIFYGNTADDPWFGYRGSGYSNGAFNNRIQEVTDSIIGNANYDIGHNFNTSGGGNAGCIGCVCMPGSKGSGYTGLPNPVGDAFYIDFVAHEMGHQFGAYHVMNTCSRSGNGQTEVEPASGSTIMGYAGVCQYNIQPHSDPHFNFVSIRNIATNIQPGGISTCGTQTALENQPPTANAGANYTIPVSTAFVLQGEGNDPDGQETLTYEWEQDDPQQAPANGPPQSYWQVGPLFRALPPTESPVRYFPKLSTVVGGSLSATWETAPSAGRVMHFSFVVRDNGSGYAMDIGQTASDLMSVTTDANAGPFKVTSQNTTGVEWGINQDVQVTWDVANTDAADINEDQVDIILSTDGGQTFTDTLAAGVPNNGAATLTVPDIATNQARIMVKASDNIFYAVNQTPFTITDQMGVNSPELTSALRLYPNPNNGTFTLTFNPKVKAPIKVRIFDMNGRQVYQNKFVTQAHFKQQISLDGKGKGLYFVRITNGKYQMTRKIVVE